MTTAEESWKFLIIATVVAGLIVVAVWLGVATISAFGFSGTLGAILILAYILAVLGVFALIGLFWLIFVIFRLRESLEK